MAERMSEDDLLRSVLDLAKVYGLYVHHCRPARTADGRWRTPIQGDKGFPDLVICGIGGVLYRELKGPKGKLTPEQTRWLHRLNLAGHNAGTWRPGDWHDGIIRIELAQIRGYGATPAAVAHGHVLGDRVRVTGGEWQTVQTLDTDGAEGRL